VEPGFVEGEPVEGFGLFAVGQGVAEGLFHGRELGYDVARGDDLTVAENVLTKRACPRMQSCGDKTDRGRWCGRTGARWGLWAFRGRRGR
jgi:hypothetical protein